MASAVIPVNKIRVDSTLGATLNRSSAIPAWIRNPLKLWLFPQVLLTVTDSLSGECLGSLSREEATALYGPLNQFYLELRSSLDRLSKRNWLERLLLSKWTSSIRRETEKLGDIVETLAWACDDDLRDYIDAAIETIERSEVQGNLFSSPAR